MNLIKSFILALFTMGALIKCSHKKSLEKNDFKKEEFKVFLTRFDKDTTFQKTRVRYTFKHKVDLRISKIDTSLFKIQTLSSDSITVNVVYKRDTSYWIKLIFKQDQGEWFLVNYLDSYND